MIATAVIPLNIDYGPAIEAEVDYLQSQIARHPALADAYPARWLALKLLESDADLQQRLLLLPGGPAVVTHAQLALARLSALHSGTAGFDVEAEIANRRYEWIHGLVTTAVTGHNPHAVSFSDRLDRIITNRWLGVPLFLLAMWALFKLTADISAPFVDWIDGIIAGPLTHWIVQLLTAVGLDGTWLESLLVDGVLAGVGGVLVFVPVLLALYLGLALIEDTGYMARAAFVMDRLMSRIGLNGKSFLPLVVGFGCNVPAIYATRTLENRADRIVTALLVPFMSCGARLPVYVLFAAVFFPRHAGLVIFALYLLGIATAVATGLLLRKTVFQADSLGAFVMELPPYRLPTLRGIWTHMWQRTRAFLQHATTLILAASVVIWLLMAIPVRGDGRFAATDLHDSLFATTAAALVPVTRPLGFGTWEATGSLVTGLAAKEIVISTLAQSYGTDAAATDSAAATFSEELAFIARSFAAAAVDTLRAVPLLLGVDLRPAVDAAPDGGLVESIRASFEASSGGYGALAGFAFLVFVLIYTPCMVTIAAQRQELGTRWMWTSVIGQLVLAWLMAFAVFQIGRLILG